MIDPATNIVVVPSITVGTGPLGVAITPDGKRAYVTNSDSGDVSVIDTATNMVVATIPVGTLPFWSGNYSGWYTRICDKYKLR